MIYLPIEHLEQRYTTHLDRDIRNYLDRHGIEYTYIEPQVFSHEIKHGSFLDADNTIYRQFYQMQKVIEGLLSGAIAPDETLFVSDLWNFALLAVPYLNYFSHYKLKVRGILHAGSFTDTDFVRQMERTYKGFEDSLFDFCERIFVGSKFIKQDVLKKRFVSADKLVVTGLPLDLKGINEFRTNDPKENVIVFNGRNVDEKQPYLFELLKERLPQYTYINTQALSLSKEEYYGILSRAKVVVSFALQENFGYGIQEAVALGCIPIVPDRLAYQEQFGKEYRYNNFENCVEMVEKAMNDNLPQAEPMVRDNEKIFDVWFQDLK